MTTNNKIQKNDAQFFAIEKKGRDGLQAVVNHYGSDMWALRPRYVEDGQKDAYFKRIITAISNDDKLKPLTQSRSGLFTLYQKMCTIVELGLNPGGVRPHCYITAFGDKATLIPTADGYKYVVTTGEFAIFKDVLFGIVHKNDAGFMIDEANGVLNAPIDPTIDRGEAVGVWVKCVSNDSMYADVVKYVPMKKIHGIRDQRSMSYKKMKASSPWTTDPEEMAIKTAIKIALKPYIGQCEGLASLSSIENENETPNVSERMEKRIDNIEIAPETKKAPVVSTQTGKPEPEPKPEPQNGDLF